MSGLVFVEDDGGRAAAGYRGEAGDCVTRAISIARMARYERDRKPHHVGEVEPAEFYKTTYGRLANLMGPVAARARNPRRKRATSPRDGVFNNVTRPYLAEIGWEWVPVMTIGSGCTMHVRADELPLDRAPLILKLSKHLVAVTPEPDGTYALRDTADPSRDGERCVYGYWWHP